MAALLPSLHSSGLQAPMSTLQMTGMLTQPTLASSAALASSNPSGVSQSFSTNFLRQKRRLPARLEPISHSSRQTVPPPTQNTNIEDITPQDPPTAEFTAEQEQELYQKAVENLQRRIDDGEKGAALVLGKLHFEMGNYSEAHKYLTQAFENGKSPEATYLLGMIHFEGLDGPANPGLGFSYMRQAALNRPEDKMVRDAQYKVGCAYFSGVGVVPNDEQCEKWFKLAAADGDANGSVRAQTALGHWYADRHHLDLPSAFAWHSCAARNGSIQSLSALGVMYQHGLGVEPDEDQAFKCFRGAAERGSLYASANLVALFYKRKLYKRAFDLSAQLASMDLSVENELREQSDAASLQVEYVRKAVAIGLFYEARCFERGLGVQRDQLRSAELFSKACAVDHVVSSYLQSLALRGDI